MDAWMWPLKDDTKLAETIQQPILFINSEAFQTTTNLLTMKRFTMDADHTERRVVTLKWVSIDWPSIFFKTLLTWFVCLPILHVLYRGSVHYNQNDVPALWPWYLRRFVCNSDIDPLLALQLNNRMSLLYLRKHLGISRLGKLKRWQNFEWNVYVWQDIRRMRIYRNS